MPPTPEAQAYLSARDFLLRHRLDHATALRDFRWPALHHFNWALDYFDHIAQANHAPALHIVEDSGKETVRTFAELSAASNRVANYLRSLGARRGDGLLLMLPNDVALWETLLAAMKLGLIVTPSTTALTSADLTDRITRGHVRHVIATAADASKFDAVPGHYTRIAVNGPAVNGTKESWHNFADAHSHSSAFTPTEPTLATDPLLYYFTSGTTAKPKVVVHTHQSYPVGHLSTLFWIGLQPGGVHWNISSPGWAKHAWSSFFTPWIAGCTIFTYNYARFHAKAVLEALVKYPVTSLCAPPTVWRMLVQEPLREYRTSLRELVSAGEPLNPEVIDQVQSAWGLTVRDGYGQTETTAQIGNPPSATKMGPHFRHHMLKPGSMGLPLPGYPIVLLDVNGTPAPADGPAEGEICLPLGDHPSAPRPLGLTSGYVDDDQRTSDAMRHGYYHTGDLASRDADGYFTYIGRADDVFKASDYRISPFELESILIEHPAVAEAAVVPSPDPIRHAVPKAFVTLAPGFTPSKELARDILTHCKNTTASYKRVRRLEFAELPKTISGKIRRVELRRLEETRRATPERSPLDFTEED